MPTTALLVPGVPTALSDLEPLAASLGALVDVHIVAPPGYGETPEADRSMTARKKHLVEVRRSLSSERVIAVGYSGGGYDAVAAARDGAEFERVVLLDAGLGPTCDAEREAYRQLGAAIAARALDPKVAALGFLAEAHRTEANIARVAAWLSATSAENLGGELMSYAASPDLTEAAVALGDRLRVIHGEEDASVPAVRLQQLAERAGAPFFLLEGLGHACFVEDPEAVAAALRQALT